MPRPGRGKDAATLSWLFLRSFPAPNAIVTSLPTKFVPFVGPTGEGR